MGGFRTLRPAWLGVWAWIGFGWVGGARGWQAPTPGPAPASSGWASPSPAPPPSFSFEGGGPADWPGFAPGAAMAAAPPPAWMEETLVGSSALRFSAGAAVVWAAPYFESNPAYARSRTSFAGPGLPLSQTRRVEEFGYDFQASPRVWLAASLDDGLGARVRWWRYDQAAGGLSAGNDPIPPGSPVLANVLTGVSPLIAIGPSTSLPGVFSLQMAGAPGAGQRFGFESGLMMDVWDFEGTISDLKLGAWSFLVSGGARYAFLEQTYGSFGGGQFLRSRQTFRGAGPTLAVEGRRAVLDGLGIYGAGRFAMLFGSDRHDLEGVNPGLTPPFEVAAHRDSSSRQRIMPVAELELGLEYVHRIGDADFVLNGGVQSQLWPAGSGAHGYGNMGLLGFVLETGFRF